MKLFSTYRFHKVLLLSAAVIPLIFAEGAQAQERPQSLIVTSGPIPESLKSSVYTRPIEVREVTAREIQRNVYEPISSTAVSGKITSLSSELSQLQNEIEQIARQIDVAHSDHDDRVAEYYASVATINTQLQRGSTPGNPRLVARLNTAESQLEALSASLRDLNGLSVSTSDLGSRAGFLLESIRAAFKLSGAIEEDHVALAELEDTTQGTTILLERISNMVSDSVTRLSSYVSSERGVLRNLALGVANGDLYGRTLSERPFSAPESFTPTANAAPTQTRTAAPVEDVYSASISSKDLMEDPLDAIQQQQATSKRILAKIKFDRPDVAFEQPVYKSITDALDANPDARFDLVAVNPSSGNSAEVAIETTRARRNAEKVLRSLTEQGLPMDKIDLSYSESSDATSSEVHLYIK